MFLTVYDLLCGHMNNTSLAMLTIGRFLEMPFPNKNISHKCSYCRQQGLEMQSFCHTKACYTWENYENGICVYRCTFFPKRFLTRTHLHKKVNPSWWYLSKQQAFKWLCQINTLKINVPSAKTLQWFHLSTWKKGFGSNRYNSPNIWTFQVFVHYIKQLSFSLSLSFQDEQKDW